MEDFLRREDPSRLDGYGSLKERVRSLYLRSEADGVKKCLCHCEANAPNWMLLPDGSAYLIDWEYAGLADPGIDVGFYISHGMFDSDRSRRFIREYWGSAWTNRLENHCLACAAVISYYWFIWVLYMEHFGAELVEDRKNMYERTIFFCNEARA